jgi:Ni/Fe-hydrogenase subunit HybB-like protein
MSTNGRAPLDRAGYAAAPVTKAPEWRALVAWDMLFNNLATGLFLVAALGELAAPEVFTPTARAAYPVALILLLADLACLVLDLGDPLRFHHMLRVFKPSSPMSLGTWCLTVFSLPLAVAAALSLVPAGQPALDWTRKAVVVLGLLPALGAALYKGVLFSTSSQPGWKDARWLGGYLAFSAFAFGCGGMLVLAVLLGQERAGGILRNALMVLLVLNLVPLGLLALDLRSTLSRIYTRRQLGRLAALSVGGETLAPLALLLLPWGGPVPALAAVLLLLLGGLALRFEIVRLPHTSA